jgi:hypothetical protein
MTLSRDSNISAEDGRIVQNKPAAEQHPTFPTGDWRMRLLVARGVRNG